MSEISSIKPTIQDALADVSVAARPEVAGPLDWVGMEGVELPLTVSSLGKLLTVPSRADVSVSLNSSLSRGIHMSRLYQLVAQRLVGKPVSLTALKSLVTEMIQSQEGLSRSGQLRLSWALPLEREALLSGLKGWRQYPVAMLCRQREGLWHFQLQFEIQYSSTCPSSAALSRQLNQEKFNSDFGQRATVSVAEVSRWMAEESSVGGTPHAQRSRAQVGVRFDEAEFGPSIEELISETESVLGTPVQTAVKRVDEQEFARRNAENLLFCEDAARRIRRLLDTDPRIKGYQIKVRHEESLHPHDAVAEVSRSWIVDPVDL